jgi:hypothetical protein
MQTNETNRAGKDETNREMLIAEQRAQVPVRRATMKRTIITLSATVALATIVVMLSSLHTTRAQNQQGSVVGTWVVSVNVDTPGGPVPLATELASFSPGGIFTDAISIAFNADNPAFAGTPLAANFSDAFGSWKPVGDASQVAATFKRFIFAAPNSPTAAYGSFFPGQNVGVATIEVVGALQPSSSGQVLAGSFTFQFTNLGGAVVLAGSGSFTATPVKIQPLAH